MFYRTTNSFNFHQLKKALFAFALVFLLFSSAKAQLIINEVSQGPSGSKEYIELLVVSTPSCTTIPCVDLRGFYIDDNNGDYANGTGTGIAQGCVRFKNTAFWSCIPIGTLIVIYNDVDPNSSIPADDLLMTDGNCKLIIPVSNCTLFEANVDEPSLSVSTHPSSNFVNCGDWSTLAMANSDDSFQTRDASGNAIFSVSWGNNSTGSSIYFSGTATGMVAYITNVNDNNPNNQSNWTQVTTSGNETPGAPNSTANAAWISSMNNNCSPIIPLTLTTNVTNSSCTCDGSITVIPTGGIAPYSYSWATSTVTTATASGLCAGTHIITVTSANGCSTNTTETITSNGTLNISVTSAAICAGQSATLTATGAANYVWSTGATTDNITESPSATQTYTVTGTSNGCTGTATGTITIGTSLNITVSPATICAGQSTTLTATGADNYVWSTGATTNSITESPTTNQTYTVTGTSNGCTGTATATVIINASPEVVVTADKVSDCEPFCVLFNQTTFGANVIEWDWDFGNGVSSDLAAPQYCYSNVGSHTVSLAVTTDEGCVKTVVYTDFITLESKPTASFTVPLPISSIDAEVDFTNTSIGALLWNWNFGDTLNANNNTSQLINPTHAYSEEGNYCVTLIASNNSGCMDTSIQCFEVEPLFTFYIPNSFTPNSDGKNDEFYGLGNNILEYELSIYNRWGKEIFHTHDINEKWDGKMNAGNKELCQRDVYVYLFIVRDINNEKHKYTGSVTLVR